MVVLQSENTRWAILNWILLTVPLILGFVLMSRRTNRVKHASLPPGPLKFPLIGNFLQINSTHPVVQFKRWAEKFGPIVHVRLFSHDIIVLNTDLVAKDLLDNRGSIYSSRNPPYFAYDLMSKKKRMVFHRYGEDWRKARKIMHQLLAPNATAMSGMVQELESRQMLHELLESQNSETENVHFFRYFQRYTSSSIMTLCYGHRFFSPQDPCIEGIFEAMDILSRKSLPGAYLVDAVPFLRRLPVALQPWIREAENLHQKEWELWGSFVDRCKREIEIGEGRDCFIKELLCKGAQLGSEEERTKEQLSDMDIGYAACALLEAGSDTVST